jgi:hypothetical protein
VGFHPADCRFVRQQHRISEVRRTNLQFTPEANNTRDAHAISSRTDQRTYSPRMYGSIDRVALEPIEKDV